MNPLKPKHLKPENFHVRIDGEPAGRVLDLLPANSSFGRDLIRRILALKPGESTKVVGVATAFDVTRETEAGEKLAMLLESPHVAELQASHELLGRDCGTDPDGRAWGADRAHQLRSLEKLLAAAKDKVIS